MKNPVDEQQAAKQVLELFSSVRQYEPTRDIIGARRVERQVARLVSIIAKRWPASSTHADALFYHECTLLALSRITRRADVKKKLRDTAYQLGAQSVDIRLAIKPNEIGTGYATYNLAIDLIVSHNSPEEGLKYMLKARRILKALSASQRPRSFRFFWINYGIAKAYYDLGQRDKSARLLKHILGRRFGNLDFGDLRGLAKSAELLAEIDLDQRSKR